MNELDNIIQYNNKNNYISNIYLREIRLEKFLNKNYEYISPKHIDIVNNIIDVKTLNIHDFINYFDSDIEIFDYFYHTKSKIHNQLMKIKELENKLNV